MSEIRRPQLKFSGQKQVLPALTPEQKAAWTFEFRPGGWIVASLHALDSQGQPRSEALERKRFFYYRERDRFWAKTSADFYGQKLEPTRGSQSASGQNDFTAQFPGKVRKILAKPGAQVQAGEGLIMVEAMKMEFSIKTETAGKVVKFLVEEGQQLSPGQRLLEFQESKE